MSTTDDDVLADIRALAGELGLTPRRIETDPSPDETMLARVLAQAPAAPAQRVPRRARARVLVGALAVAATVAVGFAVLDVDDPADPPAGTTSALDSRIEDVPVPTTAAGGSADFSARLDARDSSTVGELADRSDQVVIVRDEFTSPRATRATVVETLKGRTIDGRRITVRGAPGLGLRPGLTPRDMVYFLRQVRGDEFISYASAYVEARPGRFFVRDLTPRVPLRSFTRERLDDATN